MAPPNTKPLALLIVVIGALIAISLVFSPRTNLANKYLFTQSQTSEEQAPHIQQVRYIVLEKHFRNLR